MDIYMVALDKIAIVYEARLDADLYPINLG